MQEDLHEQIKRSPANPSVSFFLRLLKVSQPRRRRLSRRPLFALSLPLADARGVTGWLVGVCGCTGM